MNHWIDCNDDLPELPGYYDVLYDTGFTDEKPFKLRKAKKVNGFATLENVTHWRRHKHTQEEIDIWDEGII